MNGFIYYNWHFLFLFMNVLIKGRSRGYTRGSLEIILPEVIFPNVQINLQIKESWVSDAILIKKLRYKIKLGE